MRHLHSPGLRLGCLGQHKYFFLPIGPKRVRSLPVAEGVISNSPDTDRGSASVQGLKRVLRSWSTLQPACRPRKCESDRAEFLNVDRVRVQRNNQPRRIDQLDPEL